MSNTKEGIKSILNVVRKITKYTLRTIGIMVLIITILGIGAASYVGVKVWPMVKEAKATSYNKLSMIDENTFTQLRDTVIYSNNGEILGEINIGNFEYAEIKDVSKWVQEGYIAVEDRNFKTHNGIDYRALARAGVALVKNKGSITQGGSTITQQVIKNNLLTQEKTWDRKLVEFFLAPELEKEYSKGKIMEFYVNTNFYGNNCYGVETASKYYFNKSVKDLDIDEAALLVGISNNPTRYNPKTKPDAAKGKRDFVLSVMLEQGVITESQYEISKGKEIELALARVSREKENYQVSYALYSAALKIMELEGFEFQYTFKNKEDYESYREKYTTVYNEVSDRVRRGGYSIHTTLDTEKQKILQASIDSQLSKYKEREEDGRFALQGAAVLVDNTKGYVEAIVGGRGVEDEFNRGFLAIRQPGSAIKPIISYGPAYDTGKYYPSLKIKDEAIDKGPKNAGGGYRGDVSMREALGRSINTIAYKILGEIGPNRGLGYLGKMRFSNLTYIDNNNTSLALGGFTYGVRVVDMAKAYSTIVNYGEYSDATCITKIEFQNEGAIYGGKVKYTKVYEPDTAYMLLDNLQSTIEEYYGTAKGVKLNGITAGAKTGTTNSQKDAWFCGVTPYYTLAVWCGYDNPKFTGMYGSGVPGSIWKEVMTELHKNKQNKEFERPTTIVEKYIDWRGNMVEYNSGKTDIFSQTLMDKERLAQLEALEKAQEERELKQVESIKLLIEEIENEDKDIEIAYLYELEQKIKEDIASLETHRYKVELEEKLMEVMGSYTDSLLQYEDYLKEEEEQKERDRQENIAREVEKQIKSLKNFVVRNTTSISEVNNREKEIKNLINKLSDNYFKFVYTSELESIMSEINEVLMVYKEEMQKQEKQEREELVRKIEMYLNELEKRESKTNGTDQLYKVIEGLLTQCENKGVETKRYRERYELKKVEIELSELEENN